MQRVAVSSAESDEAAVTFRVPQPQPGKTTLITSLTKETVHSVLFGGILPSIPLRIKCAACKQIVRPVLEYSSGSWDSLTKTQKNEIEAVQRRAAKLVYNIIRTTIRQALPTICYSLTNSQIGVATHASNYLASTTSMRKKPSETTSKEPAWLIDENIRHSTRYHTPTCNTISNHSLSRLRRSGTSCQSTVIILHYLISPNLLLLYWWSPGYITQNSLWQTRKQVSGATILLIGALD